MATSLRLNIIEIIVIEIIANKIKILHNYKNYTSKNLIQINWKKILLTINKFLMFLSSVILESSIRESQIYV